MSGKNYWVYMLLCENNSYYTGYTDNLPKRFEAHIAGKGGKYTRAFKPISIAYSRPFADDKSAAMRFEHWVKQLTRAEKMDLIKGVLALPV